MQRETEDVPIRERWYRVSVDPILDQDGNLNGAVHIITDITEQKVNEESLRLTHRALRVVLNTR